MKRRNVLRWLVRGFGLTVAGAVGIPAIAAVISPLFERRHGTVWRKVGMLDELQIGEVSMVSVQGHRINDSSSLQQKGVFVWRRSVDEVVVFSRHCTDLSCPVIYDPGSGWFFCPCHGGVFNGEGEPVAGPPSRPLYRYAHRIRNGMIEIDLHSLPPMT